MMKVITRKLGENHLNGIISRTGRQLRQHSGLEAGMERALSVRISFCVAHAQRTICRTKSGTMAGVTFARAAVASGTAAAAAKPLNGTQS